MKPEHFCPRYFICIICLSRNNYFAGKNKPQTSDEKYKSHEKNPINPMKNFEICGVYIA